MGRIAKIIISDGLPKEPWADFHTAAGVMGREHDPPVVFMLREEYELARKYVNMSRKGANFWPEFHVAAGEIGMSYPTPVVLVELIDYVVARNFVNAAIAFSKAKRTVEAAARKLEKQRNLYHKEQE